MNEENAQVIYDLLDRIKVTDENRERMEKIRKFLSESKFQEALDELQILQMSGNVRIWGLCEVKEKERKIKERKQEEGLGYPVELARYWTWKEIYWFAFKWCKTDFCILFLA